MKTDNDKDKDRRVSRTCCKPRKKASSLDIEGVDLGVTTDEIVRHGPGGEGPVWLIPNRQTS